MAQRQVVVFTDDMSGEEYAQGKGETVTFGLDGTDYEIDLAKKNADGLRKAVATYVEHARRAKATRGSRGTGKATTRDREQTQAIRDWAKSQGLKVSDRGRISAEVEAAFEAAH